MKINGAKEETVRERGRDGGVEVVGMETEFAKLREIGERRRERTGELKTW